MKIAREQNQQLAVGPVYLLAESDKTQKSSTTTFPLLVVSWLQALCLVPGARPSDSLGRPPWDDELRDVQPYLVQPDPVKCGRIAVWWPAAPARAEQPILNYDGYPMVAVLGRGKLAKTEGGLIEPRRNSR